LVARCLCLCLGFPSRQHSAHHQASFSHTNPNPHTHNTGTAQTSPLQTAECPRRRERPAGLCLRPAGRLSKPVVRATPAPRQAASTTSPRPKWNYAQRPNPRGRRTHRCQEGWRRTQPLAHHHHFLRQQQQWKSPPCPQTRRHHHSPCHHLLLLLLLLKQRRWLQ